MRLDSWESTKVARDALGCASMLSQLSVQENLTSSSSSCLFASSCFTVQDNLHAHAQNESIKNLLAPMCRVMPFSARALKLYSFRQRARVITLSPHIFSTSFPGSLFSASLGRPRVEEKRDPGNEVDIFFVFFLHVERFCKRFRKERVTRTDSSFA